MRVTRVRKCYGFEIAHTHLEFICTTLFQCIAESDAVTVSSSKTLLLPSLTKPIARYIYIVAESSNNPFLPLHQRHDRLHSFPNSFSGSNAPSLRKSGRAHPNSMKHTRTWYHINSILGFNDCTERLVRAAFHITQTS